MINSRDIKDLTPNAQIKCSELLKACAALNIKAMVIQTLRDAEYQASLYQKGRPNNPPTVTNCDGITKKSAHQSGNAFDVVPVDDHGKIKWNDRESFKQMAMAGKALGLKCGYYFKMVDSPHFEL